MNSVKASFVAADKVVCGVKEGWTTSFEIAKMEGIPHDHPAFQKMLESMQTRDHTHWSDVGMEVAYKAAELPGYFYNKTDLTARSHEECSLDEVASNQQLKKAKFMITEDSAGGASAVVVQKPEQVSMAQFVKVCNSGLHKCEEKAKELKTLMAKLSSLNGDGVHAERVDAIKQAVAIHQQLEGEVLQALAIADAIESEDQALEHNVALMCRKAELLGCYDAIVELITKTKAYISSL